VVLCGEEWSGCGCLEVEELVVRMRVEPLLVGGVLNCPPHLVVGHRSNANISSSEVGAQLLGLHLLPPLESTAKTEVDITVSTVPTFIAKSACAWDEFLAHHASVALQAQVASLAVAVAHARFALASAVQGHAGTHTLDVHIDADSAVAAVLVARALFLIAGVLLHHRVLAW